ncbi:hypothetical protein Tco_1123837 [Tanacetum coccineum]|uniref:Uncharacterized protein n=1 Tax=Tanacetum coccineum TaxID=301880 RepID=A0ABQ5J4G0_9ASTR
MCKTKPTLYVADGLRWWCSNDEGYDGDEGDVGTKVVVDRGGDGRSGESVVMDGSDGCDDDGGGVGGAAGGRRQVAGNWPERRRRLEKEREKYGG